MQAIGDLHNVKREDLPRFLAALRAKWAAWQAEQEEEWARFVEETGLQARALCSALLCDAVLCTAPLQP